ncbi:carbonic anhydrase [Cyathus striatus]|nr:carbonic anhydrase [Cyathus striatus]
MFLGCSDNLLNADTIFKAPVGSMISQNTIANQYFARMQMPTNSDAAVTYAVENLGVKHIIVLGHYGCKSVEIAIAASEKPANAIEKWVRPITEIFLKSRRAEIRTLELKKGSSRTEGSNQTGFKAVIEENVKASVSAYRKRAIWLRFMKRRARKTRGIRKTRKGCRVYVHGLVYNEADGEVKDLRVSFGPFGKKIPTIPFAAVMPPKAQNKAKHLPGFFKGKKQPKKQSGGK